MMAATGMVACPKCGYTRKKTDVAPDWQCPSCGIAMHKYRASLEDAQRLAATAIEVAAPFPAESRLPLARRAAHALPDLATALLFLWCWNAPGAWRHTLASELALVVLMEFFVVHSGMFLGAAASAEREDMTSKLLAALIIAAFYLPVAGGFAYWHGGWWPFLAFAWLLLAQLLSLLVGQGSRAFESKRQRFYWTTAVGYYVLFLIVALLPMPKFGLQSRAQFHWDTWWNLAPQNVIAWGFFYFAALALTKLFEKPEWMADHAT